MGVVEDKRMSTIHISAESVTVVSSGGGRITKISIRLALGAAAGDVVRI